MATNPNDPNFNNRAIGDLYYSSAKKITNENITFDNNLTTHLSGNEIGRAFVNLGVEVNNTGVKFGIANSDPGKQDKNQQNEQQKLPMKNNSLEAIAVTHINAECRMCSERTTTKLLRFVCCPDRIVCLDCAKGRSLCPKCSKQLSDPQSLAPSSSPPESECRLCLNQNHTRVFRFLCCDIIALCLDCVYRYTIYECTKCTKIYQEIDN